MLAFRAVPGGERAIGKPSTRTEEALLARVARGDEAALGSLYDRFGRVAYGLALRILRDERLAEDAVQEAFLAVWRQAASFAPHRANARTWVLTLVHRRAVDLVRREERRRADLLEPETEAARRLAADDAELRRRAGRSSGRSRSSRGQRRPIELAYYGGLSQIRARRALGQPLGTIKSRMFTGLKRLGELLGSEPSNDPLSFEAHVKGALDSLPENIAAALENVAVVIEDKKTPRTPISSASTRALPSRSGLPSRSAGCPSKISIYRLPLEDEFGHDPELLERDTHITVLHELGHYFGIEEDRIAELGYE